MSIEIQILFFFKLEITKNEEVPRHLIQDAGGRQHPKDHGAAPRSLKNPQGLQGETSGRGGVCRTHSIAGTTETKKEILWEDTF